MLFLFLIVETNFSYVKFERKVENMIALTLKSLCSNVVIQWIFKILTLRKQEISSWKVDIDQWVDSMKLEKIRNCLLEYSINATFEDLLEKVHTF